MSVLLTRKIYCCVCDSTRHIHVQMSAVRLFWFFWITQTW